MNSGANLANDDSDNPVSAVLRVLPVPLPNCVQSTLHPAATTAKARLCRAGWKAIFIATPTRMSQCARARWLTSGMPASVRSGRGAALSFFFFPFLSFT